MKFISINRRTERKESLIVKEIVVEDTNLDQVVEKLINLSIGETLTNRANLVIAYSLMESATRAINVFSLARFAFKREPEKLSLLPLRKSACSRRFQGNSGRGPSIVGYKIFSDFLDWEERIHLWRQELGEREEYRLLFAVKLLETRIGAKGKA